MPLPGSEGQPVRTSQDHARRGVYACMCVMEFVFFRRHAMFGVLFESCQVDAPRCTKDKKFVLKHYLKAATDLNFSS